MSNISPSKALLEVTNLKTYFPVRSGLFHRAKEFVKAVDQVSLEIHTAKTLGIVGESGCGKSTLGRSILQLIRPTDGQVHFNGVELTKLNRRQLKPLRRNMQMIFQDPFGSLNPRMSVMQILSEPLDTHHVGTAAERIKKIYGLIDFVGLARSSLSRYPHEFSGGQRQRIGIARALTLDPKFIVADEPVSALDVSVQSQVLNLISDAQREFNIAFLFIAHGLAVVQHISHRVAVMYLGKIVEEAGSEELYTRPRHPYTKALLSAVPQPDPKHKSERILLKGDVPSPLRPPSGCPFHPRCRYAVDRCRTEVPVLKQIDGTHKVSCHLVSEGKI